LKDIGLAVEKQNKSVFVAPIKKIGEKHDSTHFISGIIPMCEKLKMLDPENKLKFNS